MLGKDKLNTTEVLISKPLIDCYISHEEFLTVNNVLKEYNTIKKEIQKSCIFCVTYYINIVDISRKTWHRKKWHRNNSRQWWNIVVKWKM